MQRRRIIFLQHASALGGSCMSLLYTIQGLDRRRFHPIVALAQPAAEVEALYRRANVDVVAWPGIDVWHHVSSVRRSMLNPRTWHMLGRLALGWRRSVERTRELVDTLRPDIVHLNACVLLPAAQALQETNVPCVWHVREHPPREWMPWRTALFRRTMLRGHQRMIFISEADRQAWVRGQRGEVIYNFVNFDHFDRRMDRQAARRKLGLATQDPVVLYVGGLSGPKGIMPLLGALRRLKSRLPNLRCLAPGAVYPPAQGWPLRLARAALPLVGSGTMVQRAERAIGAYGLKDVVQCMPFSHDMPTLYAAADVLVFPATVPHFARPVIEAGAMAKPVVASDLAGPRELVVDGSTGYLARAGDSADLAHKLTLILTDKEKALAMGEAAHARARQLFAAHTNCERIMAIYDNL